MIVGPIIAAIAVVAVIASILYRRRRIRGDPYLDATPKTVHEAAEMAVAGVIEPYALHIEPSSPPSGGRSSEKRRLLDNIYPTQSREGYSAGSSSQQAVASQHSQPEDDSASRNLPGSTDPAAIPHLIQKLNIALANLPPELVSGPVNEETPPEYAPAQQD